MDLRYDCDDACDRCECCYDERRQVDAPPVPFVFPVAFKQRQAALMVGRVTFELDDISDNGAECFDVLFDVPELCAHQVFEAVNFGVDERYSGPVLVVRFVAESFQQFVY